MTLLSFFKGMKNALLYMKARDCEVPGGTRY